MVIEPRYQVGDIVVLKGTSENVRVEQVDFVENLELFAYSVSGKDGRWRWFSFYDDDIY